MSNTKARHLMMHGRTVSRVGKVIGQQGNLGWCGSGVGSREGLRAVGWERQRETGDRLCGRMVR